MRTRHAVIVGIIVCVMAAVLTASAITYPGWKPGVWPSAGQPLGYPLMKCNVLNASTSPDSVVAPLNWRIARVDVEQIAGGVTDEFHLAIKVAYHGTLRDSFPVKSGSRTASQSSGTTVSWMMASTQGIGVSYPKMTRFPNTDKVYLDKAVDSNGDAVYTWCAYLVKIMASSEDRVSDSTIGVFGVDARRPDATVAQRYEASVNTVDFPILSFLEL